LLLLLLLGNGLRIRLGNSFCWLVMAVSLLLRLLLLLEDRQFGRNEILGRHFSWLLLIELLLMLRL
jgi:hypothetical protein